MKDFLIICACAAVLGACALVVNDHTHTFDLFGSKVVVVH